MKKLLISIVFIFSYLILNAQTIQSMEFQRQEMSDILLALAESSGTSILPDETVTGKVSFYFSESSLKDALDVFSETYHLFYEKDGNIIKVSKIDSDYDSETKKLSIKVHEASLVSIIRNISVKEHSKHVLLKIPSVYASTKVVCNSPDCAVKLRPFSLFFVVCHFYHPTRELYIPFVSKNDTI